jgi:hypothetical protein
MSETEPHCGKQAKPAARTRLSAKENVGVHHISYFFSVMSILSRRLAQRWVSISASDIARWRSLRDRRLPSPGVCAGPDLGDPALGEWPKLLINWLRGLGMLER